MVTHGASLTALGSFGSCMKLARVQGHVKLLQPGLGFLTYLRGGQHPPVLRRLKVWRCSPWALSLQWVTRSTSREPGFLSSQSAKVRTGIWCLRTVLSFVVLRPRKGFVQWSAEQAADGVQAHLKEKPLRLRSDPEPL